MPIIKIPSEFRKYTGNKNQIKVSGSTLRESIECLISLFPALKEHLFDKKMEVHSFINIFLDNEDIRFLQSLDTKIEDNSELAIIPIIGLKV